MFSIILSGASEAILYLPPSRGRTDSGKLARFILSAATGRTSNGHGKNVKGVTFFSTAIYQYFEKNRRLEAIGLS